MQLPISIQRANWVLFLDRDLSLDNDLMTGVPDPVHDCSGDKGIGTESLPVGHNVTSSGDDVLGTEPTFYAYVESSGSDLIDGLQAEVVYDH